MSEFIFEDKQGRLCFNVFPFKEVAQNLDVIKNITVPVKYVRHRKNISCYFVNFVENFTQSCIMLVNEDGTLITNRSIHNTTLIYNTGLKKYILNTLLDTRCKLVISYMTDDKIYTYVYSILNKTTPKFSSMDENVQYGTISLSLECAMEHSKSPILIYVTDAFKFDFKWISTLFKFRICVSHIDDLKNQYFVPVTLIDYPIPRQIENIAITKNEFCSANDTGIIPHNQVINKLYTYRLHLLNKKILKKYQRMTVYINVFKTELDYCCNIDAVFEQSKLNLKFHHKHDALIYSDLSMLLDYDFLNQLECGKSFTIKSSLIM